MIALVVILLVLTVLSTYVRVHAYVYIDLLESKGFFTVRSTFLPIFSGLILIEGNNLMLKRKKRSTVIRLSADRGDRNSVAAYISKPLFRLLVFKEITLYAEAGSGSDAAMSAMMTGTAQIVGNALGAFVKARSPALKLRTDFTPVYGKDEMEVTLKCVLATSLLDMLCGLAAELFVVRDRREKQREKLKRLRRNAKIIINKRKIRLDKIKENVTK